MEYVLLDMKWNTILSNEKLDYDISQFAAIHIDESLHTVSTFYRISAKEGIMARKIAYMMDVGDEVIMNQEMAWNEFRKWLPENVNFIVWNSEIERVWNRCNKRYRKRNIGAEIIDLQRMQEAMFMSKSGNKSLDSIMKMLGLVCENTYMTSALYSVQCMLRLYRKLWKEGRKSVSEYQWETYMLRGDYEELRKMSFFQNIIIKQVVSEYRNGLEAYCKENHFDLCIKRTSVEINAIQAVWEFDMLKKGADLCYIPKQYVQVPRYDVRMEKPEQDMLKCLQKILETITSTEDRLKAGVGNKEIERLILELGAMGRG